MCRASTYSKEIQRSLNKFKEAWNRIEEYQFQPRISDTSIGMFYSDFVGFSWSEIELKGNSEWRWNQSVANIAFPLNENTTVYMHKLNSRKKKTTVDVPSYKIWVYKVHVNNSIQPSFHAIWCEKGIELPSPFIEPATITLADLSFLKPFVSENLAASFNW